MWESLLDAHTIRYQVLKKRTTANYVLPGHGLTGWASPLEITWRMRIPEKDNYVANIPRYMNHVLPGHSLSPLEITWRMHIPSPEKEG